MVRRCSPFVSAEAMHRLDYLNAAKEAFKRASPAERWICLTTKLAPDLRARPASRVGSSWARQRRCRFHGGLSTGPKTAEGKARIAEAQRRRWAAVRGRPEESRSFEARQPSDGGMVTWSTTRLPTICHRSFYVASGGLISYGPNILEPGTAVGRRTRPHSKGGKPADLPVQAVYSERVFVNHGGLLYYGVDRVELYRGAASYVDRILRGEKPGDLPYQQSTKYELVINLKTAKSLGLAVPSSMQFLANEVIELLQCMSQQM
jgi:ABC transporter substrate binding protein